MNTGVYCLHRCGGQGICEWCGTEGICCRKGWGDTSNGCDGSFGGLTKHECVLNPGK